MFSARFLTLLALFALATLGAGVGAMETSHHRHHRHHRSDQQLRSQATTQTRNDADIEDSSDADGDQNQAPAASAVVSPAAAPSAGPAPAPMDRRVAMQGMLDAEKEKVEQRDPAAKLRKQLGSLLGLQDKLQDQWAALAEPVYTAKIDMEQKAVAKETDMPGAAAMLGGMRRDMHKYASPFYMKELERQIDKLQQSQEHVADEIDDVMDEAEDREDMEEEKRMDDKKVKRAKTEAKVHPAGERGASFKWYSDLVGVCIMATMIIGVCVFLGFLYSRSRSL